MQQEQFLSDETLKRAVVWDVAKNIIPTLTTQIETIISSYQEENSRA